MKTAQWLVVAGLAVALNACSKKDPDIYIARDVEVLYNLGMDSLEKKQHQMAAISFDEVERQHPYSSWARKAQLMSAYSYYMANKYDDAVLAADRFLQLHPGNKWAPYAFYLKGLSYYEQIIDVGRDQRLTEKALAAFNDVISRYPDSIYARDARLKRDLVLDHLAGKEMEVGRYYEKQGFYVAAIGRFRRVVDIYQTTSHVPEALHRLTESYTALGLKDEATQVAAVLGHNYPGTKWYRYSYDLHQGKDVVPESGKKGFFKRIFGK